LDTKKIFDFATQSLKKRVMSEFNADRDKHADTIIRNHVLWTMGTGFIPVPVADVFAASALQLDMIKQLCKVYDVNFSETQGKAIVTSLTSSTLARIAARSVIKLIPGVGSLLGGVAVSIFAGASTYALGEVFKKHFESGGTILDFDPSRLEKMYKEKFEKGKKVAEQLSKEQKEKPAEAPVATAAPESAPAPQPAAEPAANKGAEALARLKELADMRDNGIISEEEFATMKKKIIDSFG
jgi:uncharacterized protein (DUF697 family)